MSKQRDSVRHAEWRKRYEEDFERLARDIAFEAGVELDVRGLSAFILRDGEEDLLCTASQPKRLWCTIWRTLCNRFPALERYK